MNKTFNICGPTLNTILDDGDINKSSRAEAIATVI